MFLKRIELTGFKSFADKTELEFVQGITAVVGPNGSGKSNVSDGIRWVLGEQSAKSLRGGKMEDVIFAGSDTRKAVNYGEVALTLDNTDNALPLDFSEVTIARRIHRSGESEYFINKQSCRLKDITELFMDTGIGKEAYSIIGQGRIEEILSTRSEDRRGIFEEASGIVKYKSRKKEAQKKIEDTEQNLLRIHDLVAELEEQVEPLLEQSEKALQFKEYKEELKSNEIAMYVYQIEQLYTAWTEANEKLQSMQQQQLELSTIVSRHDAGLEKHRWESRNLEEQLESLQVELLAISEDFEKNEGLGEVLKERKKHLQQNNLQLLQTIATQDQRIAEKQTERSGFQDKFVAISHELEQLQNALLNEEQKLIGVNGSSSSEAEDRLKAELLDTLNKIAQTRNELRYIDQQTETLGRRVGRLEEERAKWLEQNTSLLIRKEEATERLGVITNEIKQTRDQYVEIGQSITQKSKLFEESQMVLRKWEQKRDALISRKDTIQEMENDFDGFMQGVKEVLKSRNKPGGLTGIRGAVAELIKVPEQVEVAVETALGGALQHIVMEDESSARDAILYLKKRQMGRATFLPLDVIKGRFIPDGEKKGIQGAEGFVGIAVDLVQFDEPYKFIFSSLLGNVIISDNLEHANRIAAKCQYRYRVVTLEGDVVNAGGSMSGGSNHRKGISLLGRKREIDHLSTEIKQAESQLVLLREKELEIKQEINERTKTLEQLRQTGERKRIDDAQVRSELNQCETEMRNMEDQLALYKQDVEVQGNEQEEYDTRKKALNSVLIFYQEEESQLQDHIRQAEMNRKANESAKEELQGQLTELKVKVAGAAQERQFLQEQLRRFDAELTLNLQEQEDNKLTLLKLEKELEINKMESLQQLESLNHNYLKKHESANKIEYARAERAQWQQTLEHEENQTREQRIALRQLEDLLHQTEVKSNRQDVELDNLLKKLSEEYELSFELAKQRYTIPDDIPATQSIVRELKKQIAQLGEVNLGAIEEYARVSERFHFLSKQKNDLIEAKTTLYHVIREMDEEMSKKFSKTFEAIREQFVRVFAILFNGGRADLVLADPEHILETGIDIIAQPPGKKLQNLQLLSGGERALTAIALLFAILHIKPVPFCVLDEVEAALDESNVTRFAEYLREFSLETQFIVVTHRKGTMHEADVLYGITMEEGGVSKLVSVRLDEDEDEEDELASA